MKIFTPKPPKNAIARHGWGIASVVDDRVQKPGAENYSKQWDRSCCIRASEHIEKTNQNERNHVLKIVLETDVKYKKN
ncbi:hypothetical protein DPMN_153820 [Dreissena polymorpha]|uniref:Uncharacterized protein n=1 Tax=Dreissena polymorpha TaxID=45954 RepID=A0A9D4FLG8_DREPO|nr:hypothetical protein DPMN_153820 [Dreissena polymorpha]